MYNVSVIGRVWWVVIIWLGPYIAQLGWLNITPWFCDQWNHLHHSFLLSVLAHVRSSFPINSPRSSPSLAHSFTPHLKRSCFTNPSHHRLVLAPNCLHGPTTWTSSSLLSISFVFRLFSLSFCFFWFRAVDEAGYHSAFQRTLNISCCVGKSQIPLRYRASEPARELVC